MLIRTLYNVIYKYIISYLIVLKFLLHKSSNYSAKNKLVYINYN